MVLSKVVLCGVVGKMKGVFWVVVVTVLVAAWMPLSYCSKKPVVVARKEDIPYIRCQVCEKLAKELHQQVHNKQGQIAPKKVIVFIFFLLLNCFLVFVSELICRLLVIDIQLLCIFLC